MLRLQPISSKQPAADAQTAPAATFLPKRSLTTPMVRDPTAEAMYPAVTTVETSRTVPPSLCAQRRNRSSAPAQILLS
eukprot:scaffold1764_cov236-Pinguiococcus_pyrenoidosus.AAC.4